MSPPRSAWLELTAALEGLSLLVLLVVAVPLKHFAGFPGPVRVCGLVHGLLFLLYQSAIYDAFADSRMTLRVALRSSLAAVVPFGAWYVAWREYAKR